MIRCISLLLWHLLTVCVVAGAYEPVTHSKLSVEALNRSILATDLAKLRSYGLKSSVASSGDRFSDSQGVANKTIEELVAFGADYEDSRSPLQATRHFYNPVNGSKLLPGIGETSPDWALEDRGAKNDQAYSYRLMRRNFFKALTEPTKADRDTAWGLTFQTLGHVMHHLQDMAQPEHVRGDAHCDAIYPCRIPGGLLGFYSVSMYEKRVEKNLPAFGSYPAVYSSSDTTTFNAPRKFWHTNPPGGQATGKGIAEFTNTNFISAGTNFDKPNLFPAPRINAPKIEEIKIADLCASSSFGCNTQGLSGLVTFFGNRVSDRYTGAEQVNQRMTTLSVFDKYLDRAGKARIFSYNRFNADATAALLVPRAVGYSAGMINYFFRGNIDMVEDAAQTGVYVIKNLGSEPMTGTFGLYYNDESDVRILYKTWSLTIPADGQVNVGAITAPTMPAPKKLDEYMLVFNGDMGEETRATYGVGAVTGAVVTLGGGNALYLTGYDSANQLVHMKVNASGTRVLDATEFHPLREMFVRRMQRTGYVAGKKYLNRQVEFSADGESYRTRALTVGSLESRDYTITYSFHGSPGNVRSSADYTNRTFGFIWQTDVTPISGTRARLHFFMNTPSSFRSLGLGYTRYEQIGGQWETTGGGDVVLPVLPHEIRQFANNASGLENLLVSPDGLTVHGFKTRVQSTGVWVQYKLVLTIDNNSTVSAAWVLQQRDVDINTQITSTSTPAGTYTIRPPSCSAGDTPGSYDVMLTRVQAIGDSISAGREVTYFDYQKGKLLGLVQSSEAKGVSDTDYILFGGAWVGSGCKQPHDYWTYQKISGRLISYVESRSTSVIESNGSTVSQIGSFARNVSSLSNLSPNSSPPIFFSRGSQVNRGFMVDWDYEGYLSAAYVPYVAAGPEQVPVSGQVVMRPLTQNAAEAILYEYSGTQIPATKFESTSGLQLNTGFIADASPLGEIFIARSDLSVVIHRPRGGGIKVWQRPAGLVSLIGAVWL